MAKTRGSATRFHVQTVFHIVGASFYVYVIVLDRANERARAAEGKEIPGLATYAGRYKYLTQINIVIQLVFFVISAAADMARLFSLGQRVRLQKTTDFLYASFAFPLATLIMCVFWSIYAIDRELIYPRVLDALVPPMMNYYLHLHIGIFILLESVICYHGYPSSRQALIAIFAANLLYCFWLHWVYYFGGFWAYRFLTKMSSLGRWAFIGSMFFASMFYFYVGRWWNRIIWSGRQKGMEKYE